MARKFCKDKPYVAKKTLEEDVKNEFWSQHAQLKINIAEIRKNYNQEVGEAKRKNIQMIQENQLLIR